LKSLALLRGITTQLYKQNSNSLFFVHIGDLITKALNPLQTSVPVRLL